ncbi:hypothetical protein ACKI1O_02445 [Streptomyces scabiei]
MPPAAGCAPAPSRPATHPPAPRSRHRAALPRELVESFRPTADEAGWARGKTTTDQTFLVLVIRLKCYQRMRYFPGLDEVPDAVIGHIRIALDSRTV